MFIVIIKHVLNFAARAISLKEYNRFEKTGDCVCHVLPEYESLLSGSYLDITCALEEDSPTSRVPLSREVIIFMIIYFPLNLFF